LKVKKTYINPWLFVPTLYFAQGIPYFIVNQISVILFKDFKIDNASITFWTSWLYLPWVIKMFWGPLVDAYYTKRKWILYTQFLMAIILGVFAFIINLPNFFVLSLAILVILAFTSATHDIAADGFYLLALKPEEQSFFAGIRSTFYRGSNFFSNSLLVWLAGALSISYSSVNIGWTATISLSALIFLLISLYHFYILPYPDTDVDRNSKENKENQNISFGQAFSTYFLQPKIDSILVFILTFRLGEAFLIKLAAPFFKDPRNIGGLGFTTEDVGIIYGFGVTAIIFGGILGGLVAAKVGLKKLLWPMAVIINIPTIIYTILSFLQPKTIWGAIPFVAIEQFSYGFGFTALTIYLMYVSRGEFKTSHYAISTGVSALGMMLPGLVSGAIQQYFSSHFPGYGYQYFFIFTVICGIPGIISLFFIPKEDI
jgi:PAT family beta-lactamase induction signal transducer AmpG